MTTVIVHLSDIHLKEDSESNSLLKKLQPLAECVRAQAQEDGALSALICVSGDIAATGLEQEYKNFRILMKTLQTELDSIRLPYHWLLVPGNHDCNFRIDSETRRLVLKSVGDESISLSDISVIKTCTDIQTEFFTFAKMHGLWQGVGKRSLLDTQVITTNEYKIAVYLINSSWLSQKHEIQGQLFFPNSLIEELKTNEAHDLSIAIMHHPYNWFESNNARALRRQLDNIADLVLTGHEHDGNYYEKSRPGNEKNAYLEGAVLQESKLANVSGFNILTIDLSNRQCKITTCKWTPESNLYRRIKLHSHTLAANATRLINTFQFSSRHEQFLHDAGASFAHPRKNKISLDDIFVCPDLEEIMYKREEAEKRSIHKGDEVLEWLQTKQKAFIAGTERSGKTSLIKNQVLALHQTGIISIIIPDPNCLMQAMAERNREEVFEQIRIHFHQQYERTEYEKFSQLPTDRKAFIVDDLHKIADLQNLDWLLNVIESSFRYVYFYGQPNVRMTALQRAGGASQFLALSQCSILELGIQRRHALISKWHSLGEASITQAEALSRKTLSTTKTIAQLLGRDFIPSHPIFILILLQQGEAQSPVDTSAGSLGFLYGVLVTKSLMLILTRNADLDTYYNYLGEFAFHMYTCRTSSLSLSDAREWHTAYASSYAIRMDFAKQSENLRRCGILDIDDDTLHFKYKYLYYFFVARHIATRLNEPLIRDQISIIVSQLHREEVANIMLFLCHFSKDPLILDEMLRAAKSLYKENPPCDLATCGEQLTRIFAGFEPAQLPQTGSRAHETREKYFEEEDNRHRPETYCKSGRDIVLDTEPTLDEAQEAIVMEARLANASFKTVQILGQILRNHPGSLKADRKEELARECYNLGLRALTRFLESIANAREEILEGLNVFISKSRSTTTSTERLAILNRVLFGMVELCSYSVIRHVADSVGTEELLPIFENILKNEQTISYRMIDVSIRLENSNKFPTQLVEKMARDVRKKIFPLSLLRRLVWFHFYIYDESRELRQKICADLNIPITDGQGSSTRIREQALRPKPILRGGRKKKR